MLDTSSVFSAVFIVPEHPGSGKHEKNAKGIADPQKAYSS